MSVSKIIHPKSTIHSKSIFHVKCVLLSMLYASSHYWIINPDPNLVQSRVLSFIGNNTLKSSSLSTWARPHITLYKYHCHIFYDCQKATSHHKPPAFLNQVWNYQFLSCLQSVNQKCFSFRHLNDFNSSAVPQFRFPACKSKNLWMFFNLVIEALIL